MALDGGSSSALYAEGRTVTTPSRPHSNILAVYSTANRYQQSAGRLVPSKLNALASLLPGGFTMPFAMHLPAPSGTAFYTPSTPAPRPTAALPIVRILKPAFNGTGQCVIPVKIDVTPNQQLAWTALRINGHLRAMTNVWPLEYNWDSTKEADGVHIIEVTALSMERVPLGRDVRQVVVNNGAQVARQ